MATPSLSGRVLRDSTTFVLAVVGLAAAAPPLAAQFTSGVDLVEIYASVTDASGHPVTGLTARDFEVLENGQPQIIQAFAEADFPLSVAVAIDRSFSMAGARLAGARAAAKTFLSALRTEDEAGVIAIGSRVEVVAPLSTDRRAAAGAIDGLDAFGTTGLYDAVIAAIDLTREGRGRRALVLLSDGSDRYSRASAADALARARAADVMVYPLSIGDAAAPVFTELAVATGGRSYHLRRPSELEPALRAIAADLRHQYLLGYAPAPSREEGWRSLEVRVDRPGLGVRTRDGVRLPGGAEAGPSRPAPFPPGRVR